MLLTAPLLPALPSTQSRSKAAQPLGFTLFESSTHHVHATVPGKLTAPEGLDHFQGHHPELHRTPDTPFQEVPSSNKERSQILASKQTLRQINRGNGSTQEMIQSHRHISSCKHCICSLLGKSTMLVSQAFIQPRKTTTF